jgi:hypothetical protein
MKPAAGSKDHPALTQVGMEAGGLGFGEAVQVIVIVAVFLTV